jgi:hypothetical protein
MAIPVNGHPLRCVHEVLGDEGARKKEMNTTIRGYNIRARAVMALVAVLLLLAVALVFALQPAPTTVTPSPPTTR